MYSFFYCVSLTTAPVMGWCPCRCVLHVQ